LCFGEINELTIEYDIVWNEKNAVIALLGLLRLSFQKKGMLECVAWKIT